MIVLLPPSETKRDGGEDGTQLELGALSFTELTPSRTRVLAALAKLSSNLRASTGALSLGPAQRSQVERNRRVLTSPTMPAVERYTGVLYDGLAASTLDELSRTWVDHHVVIGSALFGLLRANDPIPAYRLSHNSKLPGVRLRATWSTDIAGLLASQFGLILDLRSEAYAALGPIPHWSDSLYVRVVTQSADGRIKALTHFNKKGKGEFVRALAQAGIDHPDAASLMSWAESRGIRLEPGASGELDLFV
jgi:cytoplasmic iron level regulating protein YaaA (DUF328/UPF0246 family)